MKKLIGFLFVVFPFAVLGADQCPTPDGCYTDRTTYEILNADGQVVDKTVYDRLVPLSYTDAIVLKYVRMLRNTEGGAKAFLDILATGGDSKAVLSSQMGP